jgi:pyruvate/2-oxoglutarate dehydrogenase complex dihydrolipoamide acyltransferase (E2) component
MSRTEVRLPQFSMGMSDAEIVGWLVSDGDTVEAETELVEVEAEKATTTVNAPAAGVIREIAVGPGDVVAIHELLCVIEAA